MSGRPRLLDVDRAKGLAITLVVLGHIVARQPPAGNAWYEHLKLDLYQFHMAFFMYLSGIAMFYASGAYTPLAGYIRYIARRSVRLLAPFLLFGAAIVFGKMLAAHVIKVDNPPGPLSESLLALLWNTHTSPATSIWYIYVIFVYCLIVPPLMWLLRGRVEAALPLAAALYWLPLPEYFYLDRIGHFFVFFMLGGLAARHFEGYAARLDRVWPIWLTLFAASFLLLRVSPPGADAEPSLRLLIIGGLSLPALHGLVRRSCWNGSALLLTLGQYSMAIYLFNTILIGAAKGVMLRFMPWDGWHFFIFAPLLLLSGLGGPILLKRTVLRHMPLLDRMTT